MGSGAVTLGTAGAATPITAGSGTASFRLVIHGAASAASALNGLYLLSQRNSSGGKGGNSDDFAEYTPPTFEKMKAGNNTAKNDEVSGIGKQYFKRAWNGKIRDEIHDRLTVYKQQHGVSNVPKKDLHRIIKEYYEETMEK